MNTASPRCLIAEDQALIGMALEAYLEEVGIEVAGPFATCADALAWIDGGTPELAILDYKLRDGPCSPLARMLRERGVPVVIYSGWPQGATDMPPELSGVPWLLKPTDRAELLAAVTQAAPCLTSPRADAAAW